MKYIFLVLIILLGLELYSRNITPERQLKNHIVFAEVYGFARYFHPQVNTDTKLWENIAEYGIAKVTKCKNDLELIDSLNSFLKKIAPEIIVQKELYTNRSQKLNTKQKYYFEHQGFGYGKINMSSRLMSFLVQLTQPYKSQIKKKSSKEIDGYYHLLSEKIHVYIPFFTVKKHKINKNLIPINTICIPKNISSIIIMWNILKHFYPYQENIQENWVTILKQALHKLPKECNEYQVLKSMRYISSTLNDGHSKVFYKKDTSFYQPPFTVKIINDKLIVNKIHPNYESKYSNLYASEITHIDGLNVSFLIDSLQEQVSYSTKQFKNLRIENSILKGGLGSKITISCKKNGSDRLKLNRIFKNNSWSYYAGKSIEIRDDSIYYMNMEKLYYNDFKKNIKNINNSKGLIIDFRGYPKSVNFLKHFKDTLIKSSYWKVPIITLQNITNKEYISKGSASRWSITPSKKLITVPVVFLTDANAISFSETCLDMVKYYKLGTIIGESTAGSNGNVNGFWIYDKYYFIFTGMKVVKNDGTLITKNGITPDINVSVTEKGILNKEDEILTYGIKYIKDRWIKEK